MTLKLQQINPKISVSVIWNKEQVFSPIPDPNPLKQEQKKQKKKKTKQKQAIFEPNRYQYKKNWLN